MFGCPLFQKQKLSDLATGELLQKHNGIFILFYLKKMRKGLHVIKEP
jgi:hypothetical protein